MSSGGHSKPYFPVESGLQPPSRKPQRTPEAKYWRSFKTDPHTTGLLHPVTALEFSPSAPHDLVAASSATLLLHEGLSLLPKSHHISDFPDVSYSPSFRCDGSLLASGCESGLIQVFDPKTRLILRRLRSHRRPVRVVRYPKLSDKLHLFSGGDDAVLNYWDVAVESVVSTFHGAHKDYIRGGSASPVSPEVFATGSYDHTVRLWDVRVPNQPVSGVFDHGRPIECVLFLPSGGLIATAGGSSVKIWDVIGGGRLVHTMDGHNKTVTSLCVGRTGTANEPRLLSVSLDGYLKVFDFASFKFTSSMRFPSPLMSVGFSPSGHGRVVGTSNGVIYIGQRKAKSIESTLSDKNTMLWDPIIAGDTKALKPNNFRYFQRQGKDEKLSEGAFVLKRAKKVRVAEHDRLLKKFRHREALVSVLNNKNPNAVIAVMNELVARRKLLKCLGNLDVGELGMLLGFLHKYVTLPKHARFLMTLVKKVIQMRAEDIKASETLQRHALNLRRMVREEVHIQRSLQEIQGIISPLLKLARR
ncbi:hypothetical protein QJS04_geneDACA015164 [Acorus gramineus]|uniref:U3 small nucleolar RNA-associated protein 15 C-terminal domain-containing protein n=1 Tax=Acorus gramineus TaxID=55184 RepID=A0AAV9BUC4_ACOGR|nr:hypothetical protein QJS04_geneDACA015164 [Acorus gramineus]